MPNVLVRDIDTNILDRLKKRATGNHRSLQSEMQVILNEAAELPKRLSTLEAARRIKASLKNRNHTDSAELLREDRAR